MAKWPGSRIQRNVKLMPKRNDITNNSTNNSTNESNVSDLDLEVIVRSPTKSLPEKRKNESVDEISSKKPKPEVKNFIFVVFIFNL